MKKLRIFWLLLFCLLLCCCGAEEVTLPKLTSEKLQRILNPMNADRYGVLKQPDTLQTLSGDKPEDIFFLGSVYRGIGEEGELNIGSFPERPPSLTNGGFFRTIEAKA